MKKLLLSLALAVGALTVSAEPITVDFTSAEVVGQVPLKDNMTVNEVYSYTFNNVAFKTMNCYQGTVYGENPQYLMLFAKATGSTGCYVEFTLHEKLEKFTITTGSSASTNVKVIITANGTAISPSTQLNAQKTEFTFEIPEANQAAGTAYQIVVDGKKYNGQIEKIVFNGDGQTVTPPTPAEDLEFANLKAFIDAANATTEATITSPVTAVYKNGRYLYIKDATASLLVYGGNNALDDITYANGDVIPAGIKGTYQNYSKGLIQMSNPVKDSFKAATAGTPVEPMEVGLDELGLGLINQYIVIKGVTIAAVEGKANNYNMTDENGETALLYNQFYNPQNYDEVTVLEGEDMNVEGFVACYDGSVQVYPIRVWVNNNLATVATPTITPAAGNVEDGTEVTITCETEGATIYYTLDGTTPTTESTVYTAPFAISETTTVSAIAAKDGMNNSAVARAEYIITKPLVVEGDATFNFTIPSSLDPAQQTPGDGQDGAVNISGVEFIDTDVTLVFNGGSTVTRLYKHYTTGIIEARLYKTGTVTITAPAGKLIKTVNLYGTNLTALSYTEGETLTPLTGDSWTNEAGVQTAVFTAVEKQSGDSDNGRVDFQGIGVVLIDGTGVANITVDANAPAEYFNLQGVRVANPENGLYIRRQGNTVTKVLVK